MKATLIKIESVEPLKIKDQIRMVPRNIAPMRSFLCRNEVNYEKNDK